MKKTIVLLLACLLCLTACGKKDTTVTPTPTATATPKKVTASQYPDKINETTYAGRLTELTDTTIKIIMDEETEETFELNDRAKRDIEILKIEVGNRIIIEFESPETRKITSVQKIQSEL